jgi:WSC domain
VRPPDGPAIAAGRFVGCSADTSDFDLDGHLERSPANTPQRCIDTCRALDFRYAGVQYGESCLCGNRYGRYGAADNCNYRCTGDPARICGGYSASSVYETGASGSDVRP